MPQETTLIILKPDCVQRGLMGAVLERFERKGLTVVGAKFLKVPQATAEAHYAEHREKPFFAGLINFVTSSPALVLAVRGANAISVCRNLIGATNGQKAAPGSIRGDFGMSGANNLVHGSDSPESAERELKLWFQPEEIVDYSPTCNQWVYDPSDL